MSDQTKQPKQPDDQIPIKDADEVVSPHGGAALPKHQQLTMTQHVFIWSLVLVVGVLFGMGSTVPWLEGGKQQVYGGDVSESDIMRRQNVAKKLQATLNPNGVYGGEQFDPGMDRSRRREPFEYWVSFIKRARHAATVKLLPSGTALDGIVKEFLNRPLPGSPNRRYAEALNETRDGDKAVTLEELRHFLAERRAVELLDAQHIVSPAVPQLFGDDMASLFPDYSKGYGNVTPADQVVVDQVILEPGKLLPTIADDDVELQATYDRLKPSKFTQPAAVEVSIAFADTKALAAKAEVSEAEIKEWYDGHLQDFIKPAAPTKPDEKKEGDPKPPEAIKAPETPKVEYKPLTEVSAGIKERLARDKAEKEAKRLVQAFDANAEELEQQKDPTAFMKAATKLGLVVREKVSIDQPGKERAGQLDIGDLGTLSENQLHLFNQDFGSITRPVLSDGANPTWVIVRVEGKRDGGFRELKDPAVMKEVKAIVAAKRGWAEFAKQAELARAAAEQLGPGGLKKWVESEAGKAWNTKVDSATLGALTELSTPPAEAGGIPGDKRPLVSLAMPARPVALTDSTGRGEDLPRFRLVQVTDYKPAAAPQGEARVQRAGQYREFLENYRSQIYYKDLSDRLGRN